MSHINQLLTTSLVNSNSQDFIVKTKTENKTFTSRPRPRFWVSRPRLYSLSSRRLETKTLSSRRLETKTVVSRTTSLVWHDITHCSSCLFTSFTEKCFHLTYAVILSWNFPLVLQKFCSEFFVHDRLVAVCTVSVLAVGYRLCWLHLNEICNSSSVTVCKYEFIFWTHNIVYFSDVIISPPDIASRRAHVLPMLLCF